jgi:Domain of unknown function (DUF1918)
MAFEVGHRVVAQHNTRRLVPGGTGPLERARHGVVEEVLRGDPNPRYRVRWDLGGESIFAPTEFGLRAEADAS